MMSQLPGPRQKSSSGTSGLYGPSGESATSSCVWLVGTLYRRGMFSIRWPWSFHVPAR